MKIVKPLLILLILSYSLTACSAAKTAGQVKSPTVGDYQYVGYDSKGTKIVEGRLSITSVEPKRIYSEDTIEIKGNWQLNKIGDPGVIGGQVGTGDLIGSIVNREIHLDLNPNMNDSNVVLVGTIEEGRFHGKWSFNGYAGPVNKGTFEANKK